MSFAKEYNAGVSQANQDIVMQRREKQKKLANYVNGFEEDNNGNITPNSRGQMALDIQQEKMAQELAYVREQNQMIADKVSADGMSTLTRKLILGQAHDANQVLNNNPFLKERLEKTFGTKRIDAINWDSAEDRKLLANAGIVISEEALNDPKKREALNSLFAKGLNTDGSVKLIHTPSLVASTNYNGYADSHTQEETKQAFNTIGEILRGHVKTAEEIRAEKAQLNASAKVNEARGKQAEMAGAVTDIKKADLDKFLEENPDATLKDYMKHLAPDPAPAQPQTLADKAKEAKALAEVDKVALQNKKLEEEIKLKKQTLLDKIKKAEAENNGGTDETKEAKKEVERLEKIESIYNDIDTTFDTLLKDGKVDNKTLAKMSIYKSKYLTGKSNDLTASETTEIGKSVNMANQMANALKVINDPMFTQKNIVVNGWSKLKNLWGISEDGKVTIKDPSTFNEQARLAVESKLGLAMVQFIKAISGSAVTDSERALLTKIMTGGDNVDLSVTRLIFNDFYANQRTLTLNTAKGYAKRSPNKIINMLNNSEFVTVKGKKFKTSAERQQQQQATDPATPATPATDPATPQQHQQHHQQA